MDSAFTDAWMIFNHVTDFIFEINTFGGIKFGTLIVTVGVLGAVITMISNYKN